MNAKNQETVISKIGNFFRKIKVWFAKKIAAVYSFATKTPLKALIACVVIGAIAHLLIHSTNPVGFFLLLLAVIQFVLTIGALILMLNIFTPLLSKQ